jgi:hypothetical protein
MELGSVPSPIPLISSARMHNLSHMKKTKTKPRHECKRGTILGGCIKWGEWKAKGKGEYDQSTLYAQMKIMKPIKMEKWR